MFAKHGWIDLYTAEILPGLVEVDGRWAKLNEVRLRNMLNKFGVGPVQFRRGKQNGRGYRKDHLADLWRRYSLSESVTPVTPITPSQGRPK